MLGNPEKSPEILKNREVWREDLYLVTLVNEINEALGKINGLRNLKETYRGSTEKSLSVRDDKALIKILNNLRYIAKRQEELKPAWEMWQKAVETAAAFVQAENKKGHNGQYLFDLVLKQHFDKLHHSLKENFPTNNERVFCLEIALKFLVSLTEGYQWHGNFCSGCGKPIEKPFAMCNDCKVGYH
jgi:hypothetical protein